jgi:hypothetical protein
MARTSLAEAGSGQVHIGVSTGHEVPRLKRSAAVRRTGFGAALLVVAGLLFGTQGIRIRHAQPFVVGQVVPLLLILRWNGLGRGEIGDISRWDVKQGKRGR